MKVFITNPFYLFTIVDWFSQLHTLVDETLDTKANNVFLNYFTIPALRYHI